MSSGPSLDLRRISLTMVHDLLERQSMTRTFRVADQGVRGHSRDQGERVRKRILEILGNLSPIEQLVIDLSGLSRMTPSFADECLGKLAEQLGGEKFRNQIRLRGAEGSTRILVNAVLAKRLGNPRSGT
ncbi:hypothetical protein B7486_01645 [cyanobacterium TDX16]|nr:hypothetical protein B7486_01645 [cyanobacterium TDX16]